MLFDHFPSSLRVPRDISSQSLHRLCGVLALVMPVLNRHTKELVPHSHFPSRAFALPISSHLVRSSAQLLCTVLTRLHLVRFEA